MESNRKKIIEKLQIVLFFLYILTFYMFGEDVSKSKISEIILTAFAGIEMLMTIQRKKINCNWSIIVMYIFTLYCLLSSFWAIEPMYSIEKAKTLFLLSTFLLFSYNFFLRIDNGKDKLLKTICWAGIIFAIYMMIYYGPINYMNMLFNGERIGGEINNVNAIGMQTSITCVVCIFYALYDKKKIYYVLMLLPLIVALGTGSRKVLVFLAIGILALFLINSKRTDNAKGKIKNTILIMLVLVAFIYIINLDLFSTVVTRFQYLINSLTGDGLVDSSTIKRNNLIKSGMAYFIHHPILGIGMGNSYCVTQSVVGFATYFHNNYVELLACGGIIGACLFYSIYVAIFIKLINKLNKKQEDDKYIIMAIVLLIINLIMDYGTVSYYSKITFINITFWLLCCYKEEK